MGPPKSHVTPGLFNIKPVYFNVIDVDEKAKEMGFAQLTPAFVINVSVFVFNLTVERNQKCVLSIA